MKDKKRFLKKDNNLKKLYLKKINLLISQIKNKLIKNKKLKMIFDKRYSANFNINENS